MTISIELEDQNTLHLIKGNSKQAFTILYHKYKAILYLHAFRMLQDDIEAEDVVQELFIKIWENRYKLALTTSVKGYLYRSITNSIISKMNRQKNFAKYQESLRHFVNNAVPNIDEDYINRETIALIQDEITRLPEKMRLVFEKSRLEGLSHKEISEELQISQTTVKKQISKAINRLKLKIRLTLISLFMI